MPSSWPSRPRPPPTGTATVLTIGSTDAAEQLRSALGVGCTAAVLVEADPVALGPADVAHEIAEVIRDHEARGTAYDLVLMGNDAADSGDFQVGSAWPTSSAGRS